MAAIPDPPTFRLVANLAFEHGRWRLGIANQRSREIEPGEAVAIASTLSPEIERKVRATIAANADYLAGAAERAAKQLPETIAQTMRSFERRREDAEAAAEAARQFAVPEVGG